jgi:outer membrane protein assembly factor BamB
MKLISVVESLEKSKLSTATVLILLLSAAFLAITPSVNAHDPPWQIPTYAYLTASPNTVGVGQYTVFVMWLDKYPPTAGGLGGDLFRGFMLDITKPDGNKVQLGPFTSSQIGSTWATYTPDQAGDYTVVFSWPGQVLTNGTGVPNNPGIPYVGDTFMASTSAPITLHVTQDPVPTWQEPAPTNDYWTRPINDANRGWSTLASNWLGGSWLVGNFQRAGQAPNSPHIVWTKEIVMGGIADAQWPGQIYDTDDYESPWRAPIIMNGRIYYNTNTYPKYGYYCVDLQTGEQLWFKNGTDNGLNNNVVKAQIGGGGSTGPAVTQTFPSLSFGQLYHYYSLNGQGVLPYLWITQGSSWYMLDANTGNWILTLKNVPGGTAVVDQDGSLLRYSYNSRTGNLLCWNSSQSIPPAGPTGTGQEQWKPMVGATIDAVNDTIWTNYPLPDPTSVSQTPWYEDDVRPRSGYTMNITIDQNLPGSIRVLQDANRVPKIILGSYFSANVRFGSNEQTFSVWALRIDEHVSPYSPQPDKTFTQNNNLGFGATLLWYKNYTYPLGGNMTWSLGSASYEDQVWTIDSKETMQRWGYSLETGEQIWGPTESEGAFNMYGISDNVAYGRIYSTGYAGVLYCYDIKTGVLLWNYTASGIGDESPYGNYPLSIGAIADGKIYLYSTEHSPTIPLWRGSYLRCLDAISGQELWKLLDFNMGMALADGYIVSGNMYDHQIYTIGKGQSATTVMATPGLGNVITVYGTVTDQSPGTTCFGTPAAGTPAIADQNMQAWMEYLYMQQPMPTDSKGVQVTLYATDPSGNTQTIGTPTTDITGHYGVSFSPTMQGVYTITAAFDGTNSYGSSTAETIIAVGPAASAVVNPTPTISPAVNPPTSATTTTTYAVIAGVVIVIVIAAAFLVLRRRK